MTPLHHHFELMDWPESTLTIRFWLITAIACASESRSSTANG